MSTDIWSVLGIAATSDERAIKRAYATRLKVASPEADAAGYMQLREAYEAAKQHACLQRRLEQARAAASEVAAEATVEEQPEPEAAADADVQSEPLTPQQQALARLHAALEARDLDGFRVELDALLASDTFATLEQQYLFIGAIAILLNKFQPLDPLWCGQIAARINVREHESPYAGDPRFRWLYEQLLNHYREWRAAQTLSHVQAHDDLAALPGYLHVYHVLTAPFDAERLNALTRSQTYHRLAQRIFERAKLDTAISIPAENRAWWERTSMAGQHQPKADPPPQQQQQVVKEQSGSRLPFWLIWVVLMLLVNVGRSCQTHSSYRVPEQRFDYTQH